MLVNKGHWFLFTVDTVLQCPASIDQNAIGVRLTMPSSPHEFFKVFLLSSDYRPNVDWPSTECWPITDRYIGEVSTNYRRSVSEVLAKSRRSVGEVSVDEKLYRPRHIWNDYRRCLDRVSSDYRPSLDRLSTAISTESRQTIDRVSTDYRPLYQPIDRSTLPTVNMIHRVTVSLGLAKDWFANNGCRCFRAIRQTISFR